jgi:Protein of unknown function (DUF1761)
MNSISAINWVAVAAAGLVYYALGGLWFSPLLFIKQWDHAIGFQRPPSWKPTVSYYLGPLLGCLVAAVATGLLVAWVAPKTAQMAALLGLTIGLGYAASVTTTNAISPSYPKPGLYAWIVGSYHTIGLLMCTLIIWVWH